MIQSSLTETKKKKKKTVQGAYLSYTTGDPAYNCDMFNKRMGTDFEDQIENAVKEAEKAADAVETAIESEASTIDSSIGDAIEIADIGDATDFGIAGDGDFGADGGDAGGGMGESLEKATSLKEDKMFVSKENSYVEIPKGIHIIDKAKIENALEALEPEEEFEVGYITPVHFYAELVDKFTLLKCTRLLGYTGVDYIEARANDDANRDKRIQISKDAINLGSEAGTHLDRLPRAGKEADFSAKYASTNKTVKQFSSQRTEADGTISTDNFNTILFYPRVGSYPAVTYYLDIYDGSGYVKVSRELLEKTIIAAVEKIADDILYGVTAKGTPKKHRWELDDLAMKIKKQLESDAKTIEAVQLKADDDRIETRSKISNGALSKPQVRALYTNQIYYLKTPYETLGTPTLESLNGTSRLNEGSEDLDYETQLKKMRDTEWGYRSPIGIPRMSDAKLRFNWSICREKGYTRVLRWLKQEFDKRGLEIPKEIFFDIDAAYPKAKDLSLWDFNGVNNSRTDMKRYLVDQEFMSTTKFDRLKRLLLYLLYAVTLDRMDIAGTILVHINTFYDVPSSKIRDALIELGSDPDITSKLGGFLKSLKENLEDNLMKNIEKLTEAKREVRRYFIRPQNIYCANKAGIIKALIAIGDKGENCSVYSLKNLVDNEDVHKLTNNDIIYYYDEGVLYDKNHIRVMDYDLYVKKEEKRKRFTGTDMDLEREPVKQEYEDRLTVADLPDVEPEIYEAFNLDFAPVNAFGETLNEAKGGVCCICGEKIDGYGNNPAPLKVKGVCCDACNAKFVIPARMAEYQGLEPDTDESEVE